jgi:predicted dehydrogenase
MESNFNWGIIGTGGIANAFANDLKYLDNHNVKAVVSRTKKNAIKFSSNFNDCKAYHNYDQFVHDSTIDGVYVATPNNLHLEHTLLALNASKPVLCEKPFALNENEVKVMIDTAKENNVLLVEAMWTRFLPHIKAIKNIVDNGDLGKINTVIADHGQDLTGIKNPRLWNLKYGGGALLDLGVYVVSFAHLILGTPWKIIAHSTFNQNMIDLQTSAIFKYKHGAQAILNTTMINSTPCRAIISGDKGRLEINPTFYTPSSFTVVSNDGKSKDYLHQYQGHGLREQAKEFAKCVRLGLKESSLNSYAESLEVMKIMDHIRQIVGLRFINEK